MARNEPSPLILHRRLKGHRFFEEPPPFGFTDFMEAGRDFPFRADVAPVRCTERFTPFWGCFDKTAPFFDATGLRTTFEDDCVGLDVGCL